jgi:hypothetical protein
MDNEISVSYVRTVHDHIAEYRASHMVRSPEWDSDTLRFGFFFFGHMFLLLGPFLITLPLITRIMGGSLARPVPFFAILIKMAVSLAAAYFLVTRLYAFRWVMQQSYRASELYNSKIHFVFAFDYVTVTTNKAQSRFSWSLVKEAVEFQDGFMLVLRNAAFWVPWYAFGAESRWDECTELVQSCVDKYRKIDRSCARVGIKL